MGGGCLLKFVKGGMMMKVGLIKKVEAVFGENKLVETFNGIDFEFFLVFFF